MVTRARIKNKNAVEILALQVLNSLFYAAVLFLIAAGFSLIFGVMGIVNMAHGSFYALGAYVTAWAVIKASGTVPPGALYLFLLLGAIAVAVIGLAIEPTLIRPFYRRPEEYQLLVTFGLLLVVDDVIRLVWGGTPLTASGLVDYLGLVSIGGLPYPVYNIVMIGVGGVAALGLWAFVYRTRFGVLLRATAQDRRMAAALGIDIGRIYLLAFGIGCLMAGLGGAIVVPTQAAVLGMGVEVLVISFVVVVIGGLGSLEGALVGALIVSALRTITIQFWEEFELAAALAALFGVVCVRHTRIFFSILTLALSQVLWTLAYKFFWITGGTDGLRVPFAKLTLLGGVIKFDGADAFTKFINLYYYYVLIVFCVCVAAMWLIVHSPFGKTLQAIRDNETRARFLGVRIWRYRWLAFLVSGIFTGLAGTLWVPLNGLTTPDVLYWPQSGKIVFFAVLGGFRNFSGPIVGAVLFNYLEVYAIALTEYWQITLGAILIILVTFLPAGIVGTAQRLSAKFK